MTDALKTIREALTHASEGTVYISGWRKYSAALTALKGVSDTLASYRSTTETMLGIEIPESEGLLEFVPCLMRAAKDRQTVVPAEPKACECPTRKVLKALWEEAAKYDRIGHEGSELLEVMSDARAALAAPCPCEGMREKPVIRCGNCEATLFHKETEEGYRTIHSCWPKLARESFSALQAERDRLLEEHNSDGSELGRLRAKIMNLEAELQRIQAVVPFFPDPKDPVTYIYELIAELCTLKVNTRQAAEEAANSDAR